jgi:hypothetical protein
MAIDSSAIEGCNAAADMMYAAVAISPTELAIVAKPKHIDNRIRPINGESSWIIWLNR